MMTRNRAANKAKKTRGSFLPFVFIGPHLLIFAIFVLIPIIYGIYISFTRWDMINAPEWVGLSNYREIFLNTTSAFRRQFFEGMGNTLMFVLFNVPVCILVPLLLALALHYRPLGHKVYQSVLYMPTLFSVTAVGIIWMQLLNRRFGLVSLFDPKVAIAVTKPWNWYALITMSTWWTMGSNMVIFQAALMGVPKELYESASIDGAGVYKQFTKITLPSIRFQVLYALVITLAGSFNVYGQPTIMTRADPANAPAIKVLVFHIRNLAFGSGQSAAGIASAMAVSLGILIIIVSFFQIRLITHKDD